MIPHPYHCKEQNLQSNPSPFFLMEGRQEKKQGSVDLLKKRWYSDRIGHINLKEENT